MTKYKFQILKKKAKWYFRIVAGNGRIIAHSEQYSSKQSARDTIDAFMASTIIRLEVLK